MIRTFKNTSVSTITFDDFYGLVVLSGDTFDGLAFGEQVLRDSNSIKIALLNDELSLSDGTNIFTGRAAVDLIMGYSSQVTRDGKQIITASDRPKDHYRCFSGCSDNLATGKRGVGDGLLFDIAPGQEAVREVKFVDDIYLRDGKIVYQNAAFGSLLDSDIVCPLGVPYPVKGTGNLDLVAGTFVPNPGGTGMYQMATEPTVIFKFASNIYMLGDSEWGFASPEPFLLRKPYYIRLKIFNASATENLRAVINMGYYRKETI